MNKIEPRIYQKALKLSSVAGALKVSGQIIAALIIYSVIIREYGVGVLGSWVLLQLIIGYGGLVHFGMGTLVTKEFANEPHSDILVFKADYFRAALSVAILVACVLSALVAFLFDLILEVVQSGMEQPVPPSCMWIVLIGVILRLVSALYGAVVTGLQRNYFVYLSHFFQLLVFTTVFIIHHTPDTILLDLAYAFTIGYVVETVFILTVLAYLNPSLLQIFPDFNANKILRFIRMIVPYFMIDIALLGREPLIKLAIFLSCGANGVGVFELASKVPSAIRQAYVNGLSALMPAFAQLSNRASQMHIIPLGKNALCYILWGAIGSLYLYGVNSSQFLGIWLGSVSDQLLDMTGLLTLWWAVAALNVPAWWLGIGMSNGWINTLIANTHLIFTLMLVGLSWIFPFDGLTVVLLWVIAGIFMQFLLYTLLELKTKMVRPLYFSKYMAFQLIIFITLAGLTFLFKIILFNFSVPPNVIALSTISFFYLPILIFNLTPKLRIWLVH